MIELRKRKKSIGEQAEQVKRQMISPVKEPESKDLISTGATMLNLALSDNPYGGYALGTVIHLIGDTHAGKSLLALNMMAEATIDKRLKDYALVYDEPESAMYFPIVEMFGAAAKRRIGFIPTETERKKKARTVQKWHDDMMAHAVPFVWVLDSFDALTSEGELKEKSPEKGGWRTEKAIVAKQLFPKMVGRIKESKSLFMWISQTVDNIGVTFGPNKTYTGGNAVKFFRSYEIWLAVVKKITKSVRDKDREIGAWVRAKVKKNKFTGKIKEVDFPIYPHPYGYGVDDIGSIINWMVLEGYWEEEKGEKKKTGRIFTEKPFIDGRLDEITKHVEENGLEEQLKKVVWECWLDLEAEITTDRKPRY